MWLFALIHAPWYNSNKAHQGDGEDMRKAMEETLYAARIDAIFAGHVHPYERFNYVQSCTKLRSSNSLSIAHLPHPH
ncbi:Purple acid phosphatase 22 [Dendrobium catenatum]|uniref:Purple acid phosphatase 22 n=1 Tax=Dendrobium catenatum TaxID=906689 RepID=A0A2I0VXC9_9ASPA|nr:Purple acid phosphatase 22 [Dendrobium catenatum]